MAAVLKSGWPSPLIGWTGCFPVGAVCLDYSALTRRSPHEHSPYTLARRSALNIGKDAFHAVGFGPDGKIALRRKIKRFKLC